VRISVGKTIVEGRERGEGWGKGASRERRLEKGKGREERGDE